MAIIKLADGASLIRPTALHARFDEEGLVKLTMEWLLRHRQTKGTETDKWIPNGGWKPVLSQCLF